MAQVFRTFFISVLFTFALTHSGFAQEPAFLAKDSTNRESVHTVKPVSEDETSPKPAPKTQSEAEGRLSRWFDLQAASFTALYAFIETDQGVTTTNQVIHQELFK